MNFKQGKIKVWGLFVSTALTITLFNSCLSEQSEDPLKFRTEQQLSFQISLPTNSGEEFKEDPLLSLSAYHFDNDILQRISRGVKISKENQFSLYSLTGYKVYFLANLPETNELQALKVGTTTLNDFLNLRSAATEDLKVPVFYSGSYQLPDAIPGFTPLNLQLLPSVASLDLDTSRDDRIQVTRIVISGASANSMLFSSAQLSSPSSPQVTYDKSYDPAITTTDGIQNLYETSTPVSITVYANLDGTPLSVNLSIAQVKRSYRYNIKLKSAGTNITGELQVTPWKNGDNAVAPPDETEQIVINEELSTLIDGVVIDQTQAMATISENGGEFTLAFTSNVAVSIDQLEGAGDNITATFTKTENSNGKVISSFLIKVKPQGKGRLPYLATLHLKRALQQFSYDQFRLSVSGSPYQLAEVTLGGVTWMAFNATTSNLEDQIYPLDGASVEETYRLHWGSTIGGLFQWGRRYKYTPWLSGSNNAGGQNQNNPWTNPNNMPCPAGYRVPTLAEMRALLPSGTTFPGTYTYNGEQITVQLHTAQPANVNLGGVTGTARYLSFTSTTGAVLYIPLSGQKGDKNSTNNPNFGHGFSLWTSQQSNTGGWAWISRYWPGTGNSNTLGNTQLEAEAFAYVRCLKIK